MTTPDPAPSPGAPGPADPAAGGPATPAPATPTPATSDPQPAANGKGETPQAPDKPVAADSAGGAEVKTTVDSADPDASQVEGRAGRQRHLRQENAKVKVAGDMVGGDKLVVALGGADPAPLKPLDPMMILPVRKAFVDPDGWAEVRGAMNDRRVVVLRAEPGNGKVAAAIRLLQSPPDRRIFNLDRSVDLYRLGDWLEADAKGDDPLPRSAGFLLCEPVSWGPGIAELLRRLTPTLELIDARLVLTVTADAALPDPEITSYVVNLPRPEQSAVLAAHVTWRLRDERKSTRLLADPDLLAFVERVFTVDRTMKAAADLAVMIGQELDGATVDLVRLERRWAERATEDFEIWFGGLPDVQARCLAIALAVLNGLPYENVVHAAGLLAERLDGPHEGDDLQPPWRDPFTTTRGELLRLLRARIRTTTVRGPFGNAPAEVIEYEAEDYASAVLIRVWHEYRIQLPLLNWLSELAENYSEDVRIWTATALGVFATQAFDYVYRLSLAPMGIHQKFWLRDVAATALSVPAADKHLRPLVEAVAAGWLGNGNNRLGQATAARVWGVALGEHGPDRALNFLERLTTIDDRRVARGIGDSMADLLLADEEGNAKRVLHRVGSWLFDDRRALTGSFVFLWLAENLTAEHPAAPDTTWPMLLLLADQRDDLRHRLVEMWHQVLRSGLLQVSVNRVLDRWADLAEADVHVRSAFARSVAALPGSVGRFDPIEQQVRTHLARWLAHDNLQPKPLTAYAVEAELAKRNGAR
ncbi:hypothetical protein AB0J80_12050 [Actinoplanes sp. NPDC049548]|uniref:hypothetical protein n=1 Tax=Actinoplanes sp. NPDC049548 TaxID=3155152 RepID=UPI0034304239